MSILSEWLRGVRELLYPPQCPVCGGPLVRGSRTVCTACRYDAPLTGFCYRASNPVQRRLSEVVPLEQASAFLLYVEGSRWREAIHRFKYGGQWRLARELGVWYGASMAESGLYGGVERVVPVPLHPLKRLRRGYNQAEYLAEGIAAQLGAEVERGCLRRVRNNPSQTRRTAAERWTNAEGIFAVRHPERLAGRHVLLVDDVLTTGATLLSAAETLLRACPDCRLSVAALAVTDRMTWYAK